MSRRHVAGKREEEGKEAWERWRRRERRDTEPFKGEIGECEMRRKGERTRLKKDAKAPRSRLERGLTHQREQGAEDVVSRQV